MSFARPLMFPVYQPTWTAEDRREWVEQVRQRYGLVTIDGGMPRQPCGMTLDGQYEGWYMTERGDGHNPATWRRRDEPDPLAGLTDWQKLGYWNEMSLRRRPLFAPDEGIEQLRRQIAGKRDARPEAFRQLREGRWTDRPEWPELPEDYAGAEIVSAITEGWVAPGYRGRLTRGRQYETDEVHPPEWRPTW